MADGSASGEATIDTGADSLALNDGDNLNSGTLTFYEDDGDCDLANGNASFNTSTQDVCAKMEYTISGYDTDSDETQSVSVKLAGSTANKFSAVNTSADDIVFTGGAVDHTTQAGIATWSAYNSQTAGAFGTFSETAITAFADNTASTVAQFAEDQTNYSWYTLTDGFKMTLTVPAAQPSGTYNGVTVTVALGSA